MNALTIFRPKKPHMEADIGRLEADFAAAVDGAVPAGLFQARELLAELRRAQDEAWTAVRAAVRISREEPQSSHAGAIWAAEAAHNELKIKSAAAGARVAGELERARPDVRAAIQLPVAETKEHALEIVDTLERLLRPMESAARRLRDLRFGDDLPRTMVNVDRVLADLQGVRALIEGGW